MNYRQVRVELMKELRAGRSKNSINAHFGFSYDKATSWEKISSTMGWDDFARCSKLFKISLSKVLAFQLSYRGTIGDGQAIVRHLTTGLSPEEISAQSGLSVHRIRRISSTFMPKVSEIFLLVDRFHYRERFLALISALGGSELNIFAEATAISRAFSKLSKGDPLVAYCATLLSHHLVSEKKVDAVEFISSEIGRKKSDVRKTLERLIEINVVTKSGNHYSIDPQFHPFGESKLEQFAIAKKYADNFSSLLSMPNIDVKQMMCCYYVGMLSADARQQVSDELQRAFSSVFRIIDEDKGKKDSCTSVCLGVFDPTVAFRLQK